MRERAGLSIEQAGIKAGIDPHAWEVMETAAVGPKFRQMWDIAYALDIPFVELVTYEPDQE